jgi:phage gp36-like protein
VIYATTADLESYLGTEAYLRLCDRDDSGAVDTSDIEEALDRASSLADSYIAKWIPALQAAAAVPRLLVQHVCDIAVYLLAGNKATKSMRTRYEDALKWLQSVADGDVTLVVPPLEPDVDLGGVMVVSSQPRVMRRDQTRGLL